MKKEVLRNQLPPVYGFGNRLDFEDRNDNEIAVYRSGHQIVHEVHSTPEGFELRHIWRNEVLSTLVHHDLGSCLEKGIQCIDLDLDPRFSDIRKKNEIFYFDRMSTNAALPVSLPAGFHFQIKLLADKPDAVFQVLQRYIKNNDIRLHDLQINAHTLFRLDHHINLRVSKVHVVSFTSSLPRLEENLQGLNTFLQDHSFQRLKKYIRLQSAVISPCMHIVTHHQGGNKIVEALCPRNFDLRQADRIRKRLSQYLNNDVIAA